MHKGPIVSLVLDNLCFFFIEMKSIYLFCFMHPWADKRGGCMVYFSLFNAAVVFGWSIQVLWLQYINIEEKNQNYLSC